MASGTIQTLRDDKGFGFIRPEGSRGRDDVFFHSSAVIGTTFDSLQEGQQVDYEEEPDPRDPSRKRAVNVTPLDE